VDGKGTVDMKTVQQLVKWITEDKKEKVQLHRIPWSGCPNTAVMTDNICLWTHHFKLATD
jgi:hypothetical protein